MKGIKGDYKPMYDEKLASLKAMFEHNKSILLGSDEVSNSEVHSMHAKTRAALQELNTIARREGREPIEVPEPFGPDWTLRSRSD